ncbi:predicted protein [Naegleria gruberi]|uniref:Predicted protein n=1 Tax=Naegleria gruberi TaxID=5762 RepID=D2VHQ9_NAEGR|nr:uncharacterized protein NAEGRDRAFT_68413 [Naegleria gruberi]EFC43638.1 predicted protein [Naegleria gruberi]|eukprot:XP_002676382.1 predicted protein [Naegleria gruberi strain NEG-M]
MASNLLRLADRCGCYNEDEFNSQQQDNEMDLTNLLSESMNIQDRIFQLHEKYELMMEYNKTYDLLNDERLSERLMLLNELCDNLERFSVNKSKILNKIQAPTLDTSQKLVKINREYQPHFANLLKSIARTMDIVHQSINNIEWASVKKKNIEKSKLEDVFKSIPQMLSKYQRFVSTIDSQTLALNSAANI